MKTKTTKLNCCILFLIMFCNYSIAQNNSTTEKKSEDLKEKEITKELSISKGGDVIIENTSRSIQIKTWNQSSVKVSTTLYYEGDGKLTDDEWFEKLNISVKAIGNSIRIKSGFINGGSYSYNSNSNSWSQSSNSNGNAVAVFSGSGENLGAKMNKKREVIIYVPQSSKLDIESKYANVSINGNIDNAVIEITNGNLDMENAGKLRLRSKYGNFNGGNIKDAEVDFINGRFSAKNIDNLDADTKYSSVEVGYVKKVIFKSTNDEYEFDEASAVQGRKNYGNLRISKLTNSIDLDGTNADVKVRNIAASVKEIKINNKYADLRLPLENIQNYSVDFTGVYSKVYASFDKKPVVDDKPADKQDAEKVEKETTPKPAISGTHKPRVSGVAKAAPRIYNAWNNDEDNPAKFTAKVGNGNGAKVSIKCQNCTVDFK